jgi:hypothetical protein
MHNEIMLHEYSPDDLRAIVKESVIEAMAYNSPSEPEEERLMSCEEACKFCRFTKPTLAKLTKKRLFKVLGKGKTIRYRKVDLIAGLEKYAESNAEGDE